jgi:hypothetical protein
MAKDRNSFAKRQREVEKKRKADEKRQRRAKKKQEQAVPQSQNSLDASSLTSDQRSVLEVFRTYLMTPGEMLCFGSSEHDSLSVPLAQLTEKGLLNSERKSGGYSLTQSGFTAMRDQV